MIALFFYILFFLIVTIVGVLAAWSDFKGMKIPNWHSVAVSTSFSVCFILILLLGQGDAFFSLWSHLISAGVVFFVTLLMFAFGGLGAGDSKLATAYALCVGLKGLLPFLFYMSIVGGVLGVAALAFRKWTPVKNPAEGTWIAQVQGGASKVPYGIAIVIGALVSFVKIGYFDIEVLASFVSP